MSRQSTRHAANFKDLTERRFGLLVAKEILYVEKSRTYWHCQCDCGGTKKARQDALVGGVTDHCGCLQSERMSHPGKTTTHGLSARPEYEAWLNMLRRCNNPECESYPRYGGRGIKVCERWLNSVEDFFADMGPKPTPKHTIDRIDNNLGYSPDNCRWATYRQQNLNNSANRYIEKDGVTLTVTEWCEILGLKRVTVYGRLARGWTGEAALSVPNPNYQQRRVQKPKVQSLLFDFEGDDLDGDSCQR